MFQLCDYIAYFWNVFNHWIVYCSRKVDASARPVGAYQHITVPLKNENINILIPCNYVFSMHVDEIHKSNQ